MTVFQELLSTNLGAIYSNESTTFRVWSTMAENINLVIYKNHNDEEGAVHSMKQDSNGVWEVTLKGDLHGQYYNYLVSINGKTKETPDPYTKGATVNGEKGMVVDFKRINPEGWKEQPQMTTTLSESILYELHIRDYSVHEASGNINKGKFLSLTETDSATPNGIQTGLNHLEEMGITHVHLLPVFDFTSVDERKEGYNWGYDPYLYNVLEGSYSSNPFEGEVRIKEFKSLVQGLHNRGIGVILDVVYNHTSHQKESPFEILMPGYYYRRTEEGYYSNGSGCGNELATEKPMVRKFIVDSLKFWLTEYKVDGFRFDLMALYDEETVKAIENQLTLINPNIILYGEPWIGGLSILEEDKRFLKGKQWGTKIGLFNDEIRNTIKGDNDGTETGFIMGRHGLEDKLRTGISGSIQYSETIRGFSQDPYQTINYVSCHDNLSLFDKIRKTAHWASAEDRRRMNRLALSIVITSFGVPFIHSGSEFLRNKQGEHNSYNAGDIINQIDWNGKEENIDIFNYVKNLIRFRKDQKIFSVNNANLVRGSLTFIPSNAGSVCYKIVSPFEEDFREILIIHNGNNYGVRIPFLEGEEWLFVSNGDDISLDINEHVTDQIVVQPISTCILVKE